VVALAADELALDDLVALVTHVVVQRLDGRLKVHTLSHRLDLVLAVRAPVVVVRALEDEAHALGCEADIAGLAPTEEVERELPHAVVRRHVIHRVAPAVRRAIERRLAGRLGRSTTHALQPLKAGVLDLTNSIVEVELSRKVPSTVVRVGSANVVGVKSSQRLVGAHTRGTRVELSHEEVELIVICENSPR
jgi:hypothetical protein